MSQLYQQSQKPPSLSAVDTRAPVEQTHVLQLTGEIVKLVAIKHVTEKSERCRMLAGFTKSCFGILKPLSDEFSILRAAAEKRISKPVHTRKSILDFLLFLLLETLSP